MMKELLSIPLLLLFSSVSGFADIDLYLYPRINYTSKIVLSHIGSIEGDRETVERIRDFCIDESLIADGYLDRREIMDMLADKVLGEIHIFGNGVRLIKTDTSPSSQSGQVSVKRGARVRFQVVKSCMRIELPGIALRDGVAGDVIPVRLKGSKVASGTILNETTVGLEL